MIYYIVRKLINFVLNFNGKSVNAKRFYKTFVSFHLKWNLKQLEQTLIVECDKRMKESAGIQNLSNVCFIVSNINRTNNNAIRIVLSETVLPLSTNSGGHATWLSTFVTAR